MPLLKNHIAVVTGAGSGIGRAIALGLCPRGRARRAARHQREGGGRGGAGDPRRRRQGRELCARRHQARGLHRGRQTIAEQVGPVSILVNNAGINRRNAFTGSAEAVIKDWQDIIAINLNGVFNVTHAFLEPLRAAKGRIVNIGSIQSFVHVRTPNSPAYTASKHGVLGFTRALAAELGKDGVRVNAIGPGLIETPLNANVRANNPELVKIFLDHTPLGRAGKPEDIVGPAIFLASDLSAYVTGIDRDGGRRLPDDLSDTQTRCHHPAKAGDPVRRDAMIDDDAAAYWMLRFAATDERALGASCTIRIGSPMSNAPHFDIDVAAFWADPYPALAKMRKEAPIAFVPQLGSTVFTRRDDIFTPGEAHRRVLLAPAGGTDEHADGPQHDAQGRRGAHVANAPRCFRRCRRARCATPGAGSSRPMPTASSTSSRPRGARRPLQGVRAAAVGRMPEGHHRADQHAL